MLLKVSSRKLSECAVSDYKKTLMKKIQVFILLLIVFNSGFAQLNVQSVFKSLLVIDGSIGMKSDYTLKKCLDLVLDDNIQLDIKELNSCVKEDYLNRYSLYLLDVEKDTVISNTNTLFYVKNSCTKYALVIDHITKTYYRIGGFKGNDLLQLLFKLKQSSGKSYKNVIADLDECQNSEINFKCMFEGLNDSPKNLWKYPCLIPCTAFVISHGRVK